MLAIYVCGVVVPFLLQLDIMRDTAAFKCLVIVMVCQVFFLAIGAVKMQDPAFFQNPFNMNDICQFVAYCFYFWLRYDTLEHSTMPAV